MVDNSVIPHYLELHGQKKKLSLCHNLCCWSRHCCYFRKVWGKLLFCSSLQAQKEIQVNNVQERAFLLAPRNGVDSKPVWFLESASWMWSWVRLAHEYEQATRWELSEGRAEWRQGWELKSLGKAKAVGHFYCKGLVQRTWVRERCVTSLKPIWTEWIPTLLSETCPIITPKRKRAFFLCYKKIKDLHDVNKTCFYTSIKDLKPRGIPRILWFIS